MGASKISEYSRWDKIYRRYPLEVLPWELGRPRQFLVNMVESGKIKKGKTLDLCTGAGTNTVYLARKGFQVIGIDVSHKALEYAKEKTKKANVNIPLQLASFVDLPFDDEQFDFVFDNGCFHHVEVEDRGLQQ